MLLLIISQYLLMMIISCLLVALIEIEVYGDDVNVILQYNDEVILIK
jgi:hypothetical protein